MLELFQQLNLWSILDIGIMALIIYRLLLLIRGTRAMQMVLGILILVALAFLLTQVTNTLTTLKWFFDKLSSSIIIIIVVLFQDDIRRVLSGMGKNSFLSGGDTISSRLMIDEISRAAGSLAGQRVGALIVIEKNIILARYVDIGVLMDARISKEIISAIFQTNSPVHDGAVIIQQGRIAAASCFLPLTRDPKVDESYGTRHRAAIGISQETDAIVVVVSEESGIISLVVDGAVSRNLDPKELRRLLRNLLSEAEENTETPTTPPHSWRMINKMNIFKSSSQQDKPPSASK